MKAITNVRKLIGETNISLSSKEINNSVKELSKLLANTYLIYLKTQNYHWNVEDASFAMLHSFFEEQYKDLSVAVDEIAERIRMLDCYTPATFNEFLKLTALREEENVRTGSDMLKALLQDHETIVLELRKNLNLLEDSTDEGTIDFLIGRLRAHEKMAWMIRSHIKMGSNH